MGASPDVGDQSHDDTMASGFRSMSDAAFNPSSVTNRGIRTAAVDAFMNPRARSKI